MQCITCNHPICHGLASTDLDRCPDVLILNAILYFSIFEPDLNTLIDEHDETSSIQDVEQLCNQINEVEQFLATKPLPCVALPTSLEDYTWLALGRTLTDLHQYLSDNKLVSITFKLL